MKIAILADIHANLEALESILIDAEQQGSERFYFLGDIIGYGTDPVACICRLKEVEAICVLGNHDQALVEQGLIRTFNYMARTSLYEAVNQLTEDDLDYINSFAFRHIEYDAVFSHANPIRPKEWEPLFLYEQIAWCLNHLDWSTCFSGHTHQAGIYCKTGNKTVPLTSAHVALGRHKYFINPGSVGQPRDGDWRASYAIWDMERSYVELRRVEYPIKRTQEKILNAGWPQYMAERLERGE
jgi:predicted phosphodiesterase